LNRTLPLGVFLVFGWTTAALAQTRQSSARIGVDAAHAEGPISPQLYGQFIEFMFGGVKTGLYAELLRDRGFEEPPNSIGLPRYWERYPDDRNDDYGLHFRWDDSVAYPVAAQLLDPRPPQHSLRVDAGAGVIERHGIFQARVAVTAGTVYRGYVWMKTSGYAGRVLTALERDADSTTVYAQGEITNVVSGWKKYEFVLRPQRSDPVARFAILFPGKGTVWLDQASLIPDDAVAGVRRDVLERVRALRPAFIRWPGGNVAQDYHWQWGVGPREQRPTWVNMSWGNEPEPSDFGTDEFVAFSRAVGAEPSLTVNVEGRGATPEEAAAWVEYCNGAASSRYGALRAANGHPQPFGVKFWEIGNEIWGAWVRGHSDASTYARNFQRYHAAMRAVDSTIRFIAVGDNDMAWNRTLLAMAGRNIDYLAIHHYYGGDSSQRNVRNLMGHPLAFEQFYREVSALARELVPDHSIGLAINEWGLDLPESRQYSMDAALYGARLMNVFERSAPVVAMSAVSDLVNGWPGGIIQAGRTGVFVSPLYHVNRLYATHLGAERLRTRVESPTYDSRLEGRAIPALDAVASRSRDGRTIFIKLVNTDIDRELRVRMQIDGVNVSAAGERELISSARPDVYNSFLTPNAIGPKVESIPTGRNFTLALPARSVSVVTLHIAQ
jgi:alpha-N-arabinofuranosidase